MIKNLKYVYTLIAGFIPTQVKQILDFNINKCLENEIEFKIIPFVIEKGECASGKADYIRQHKASLEPCILYVDWDCKILTFPDFDPNVPMLGKENYIHKGIHYQVDQWAVYNGNRLDIFKDLIEKFKGSYGEHGAYYQLLNSKEFVNKFKPITEFQHLRFGTGRNYRPL